MPNSFLFVSTSCAFTDGRFEMTIMTDTFQEHLNFVLVFFYLSNPTKFFRDFFLGMKKGTLWKCKVMQNNLFGHNKKYENKFKKSMKTTKNNQICFLENKKSFRKKKSDLTIRIYCLVQHFST
uniref:(northern house mosquito) hypothetical protein n=1 Tax=Culex pipiens TaxID=7175 RepID=A0A8D8C283_CULPI